MNCKTQHAGMCGVTYARSHFDWTIGGIMWFDDGAMGFDVGTMCFDDWGHEF